MIKLEEHLAEIRRCETMLRSPKNDRQKHDLNRRLYRLRREYRQAKIYLAEARKK